MCALNSTTSWSPVASVTTPGSPPTNQQVSSHVFFYFAHFVESTFGRFKAITSQERMCVSRVGNNSITTNLLWFHLLQQHTTDKRKQPVLLYFFFFFYFYCFLHTFPCSAACLIRLESNRSKDIEELLLSFWISWLYDTIFSWKYRVFHW